MVKQEWGFPMFCRNDQDYIDAFFPPLLLAYFLFIFKAIISAWF